MHLGFSSSMLFVEALELMLRETMMHQFCWFGSTQGTSEAIKARNLVPSWQVPRRQGNKANR